MKSSWIHVQAHDLVSADFQTRPRRQGIRRLILRIFLALCFGRRASNRSDSNVERILPFRTRPGTTRTQPCPNSLLRLGTRTRTRTRAMTRKGPIPMRQMPGPPRYRGRTSRDADGRSARGRYQRIPIRARTACSDRIRCLLVPMLEVVNGLGLYRKGVGHDAERRVAKNLKPPVRDTG